MILDRLHNSPTIFILFVILFWQSLNFIKFLNILQFHKYWITIRRNFYFFENPFPLLIHFFSSATNSLLVDFCDTIFLDDWFYYHPISFQWLNVCFYQRWFNFSFCFMFLNILIVCFFVIVVDIVLFVLILIIFDKHFGFFL